jgi:hypothetical protein
MAAQFDSGREPLPWFRKDRKSRSGKAMVQIIPSAAAGIYHRSSRRVSPSTTTSFNNWKWWKKKKKGRIKKVSGVEKNVQRRT